MNVAMTKTGKSLCCSHEVCVLVRRQAIFKVDQSKIHNMLDGGGLCYGKRARRWQVRCNCK